MDVYTNDPSYRPHTKLKFFDISTKGFTDPVKRDGGSYTLSRSTSVKVVMNYNRQTQKQNKIGKINHNHKVTSKSNVKGLLTIITHRKKFFLKIRNEKPFPG